MLSLSLSLSEAPSQTNQRVDVFRHRSAQASCQLHDGVLRIDYSGVISQANFHQLDLAVLPSRQCTVVALEWMDKALTVVGHAVADAAAWPRGTPPSVVIVREDQLQMADAFNRQLGCVGVIRMAFLRSQTGLALGLVERIAG